LLNVREEFIKQLVDEFNENYDYHYGPLFQEALEKCWDEAFAAGQDDQHESGASL
jgi:hypothetical protein